MIKKVLHLCLAAVIFISGPAYAQQTAIFAPESRFHPVMAENGMVVTQEAVASRVGVEILKKGGNAVDAAVAVGFALAVTLPRAGNLGGGGFMLVHLAEKNETIALDYREMAPQSAFQNMFLDKNGDADPIKSRFSHAAAGVPGTVAGLVYALEKYGTLSLSKVIAPAIKLAQQGIIVTHDLANSLKEAKLRLLKSEAAMAVFYKPEGALYMPGDTLIQPDLADSLKQIAGNGVKAFYEGSIAQAFVADMETNEGLITADDLKKYQPVVRKPVEGTYQGHRVLSMPPPSSGGIHLIQILNILEGMPLQPTEAGSAAVIHLMAEAMKPAYADRSKYLGDPDFVDVPVRALTDKKYAKYLQRQINPVRARASTDIAPAAKMPFESNETTHFSVVDKWGNAVANTYTLNFSYGSGIMVPGTGILLNNEMDDFSAKPGVPNAYGLIGGAANAVEGGKRPLSSMTPTIVLKNGKVFLVTGSPGGSRIITTVLQVISNVIDHNMNLAEATAAPRVHHQWLPDELRVEKGISPDTIGVLEKYGHKVVQKPSMGSTQSIMRLPNGTLLGASDPRRAGSLAAGY